LLDKYSSRGPRYTSYPPANRFQTHFSREQARNEWQVGQESETALYVHLPFCYKRCAYCGCYTEIGHTPAYASAYVKAVLQEAACARLLLGPHRTWEQLALGGGTPTFLSPGQMTLLVQGLDRIFPPSLAMERSIELNPETMTVSYLEVLVALGFNRFSFGVQDLDPDVQKAIHRSLDDKHLLRLLHHLQKLGVTACNLDLVYGLPGQTWKTFSRTLDRIIDWQPSRLALFGYAHLPKKFPHQEQIPEDRLPRGRERADLICQARNRLVSGGYIPVGLDHFARPGDALLTALGQHRLTRNFMGYTVKQGSEVVGLGASAISSIGRAYTQNRKGVQAYLDQAPGLAWDRGMLLTPEDELRRAIIQELLCHFHLDIAGLENRFGLSFHEHFAAEWPRLHAMENDGLLTIEPDALCVTGLGRIFIRNLCMVFDHYLETTHNQYSPTL
jgi:oxygen-independent coproporphyrinogen-3 oxidase